MDVLQTGGLIAVGLIGQKLLTGLIRDQILARIFPTAAPVTTPPAAGLGGFVEDWGAPIAGALAMAGGIVITNMVVKEQRTKSLIMGGFGAGLVHSLIVFALDKLNQPAMAQMLAGEGTSTRIAAMYGLGAGASLQPQYAPIGEYFSSPMSGMGAAPPLMQAAAGFGLGEYGANPDIYQAAAGVGAEDSYGWGHHISPSSNLDRELTIAEAAAGVGAVQPYEASAGMGEYFSESTSGLGEYFSESMSGLGAVQTTPAADTWIPGQANPQLWAGVKSVSDPQGEHMMLPAGVLETSGGQGIFG